MYAVVEISGKQYKVEEGKFIDVDLQGTDSESLSFDKVLLASDSNNSVVGTPYIDGAEITAKVMKSFKDKKVLVYKMRPKKGTRTKQGHRQKFTRLMIEAIKIPALK